MDRQRGSSFIEILIATAILGTIGIVFVSAIGTGMLGANTVEEHSTAESLARTQIEYIKSLPYADDDFYPLVNSPSTEYTPQVEVTDVSPTEYPNTLQKILVTVLRNGQPVLSIESLKVKR